MATAGGVRGPGPERAYAPDLPAAGRVVLDAEESAHLIRSRRVRAGDEVVLFDGRGTTVRARVIEADPRAAVVEVEGDYPARVPVRRVRVAASLPEGGRADRMVGALAELGVRAFAPLACARTPPGRMDMAARRAGRWARLAREAAKINGCAHMLEIHAPLDLAAAASAGAILLDPDPAAAPLVEVLGADPEPPWLLVGPEGGFTADELETARESTLRRATIGAAALRTDTAAVAAAAIALGSPPSETGSPYP